jgi:hypothetical protein
MGQGSKYQETKGETCVQIAKRMRADVKEIDLPAGATVHVTSDHNSIGIIVRGLSDAQTWLPQDDDDRASFRRPEYTPVAAKLVTALEKIHGSYGYSNTDISIDHFDQRYYGRVEIERDEHAAWRAEWDAEKRARAVELKAEKNAANAAPFYAGMTDGGIGVFAKSDHRRVTLIKLRPYELRAGLKKAEIEYYLGVFGYSVVRYDRVKRQFAVTRKPVAA